METYLHGLLREEIDPIDKQYLEFIPDNIPAPKKPKKTVLVIGAGMAGLVAAGMLKKDHTVYVVEANTRVGGRCKTFRNADGKKYWKDGELTAEAGAMRLPDFHRLVQKYIEVMGLKRQPFYNVSVDKEAAEKWRPGEPQTNDKTMCTFVYVNYLHSLLSQLKDGADVNELLGYNLRVNTLPDTETPDENRPPATLLDEAVEPLRDFIAEDPMANWPVIIDKFGEYSMRRFLLEQTMYSENAIEMIGVLQNLESRMSADFIQSFIEMTIISPDNKYWQISGGTWLLPEALYEHYGLAENTYFNCRVTDLYRADDGKGKVKINVTEEDDLDAGFFDRPGMCRMETPIGELEFDEVIVTIPFSAFRQVHVWPKFTQEKRKAIRELHYDSATKVILEFSERWWEKDPYNIVGGGSVTDMSNRFIYYPSQNIGRDGRGVVLAVYCWADDARRWDSMSHIDRYHFALENLAIVHTEGFAEPRRSEERNRIKDLCVLEEVPESEGYVDNVRGAATVSWMQNPYAFGEAAIFAPGQLRLLQKHIVATEWDGRVHFAGEHASLKHAWIEGAIESGIRAALEVNEQELELSDMNDRSSDASHTAVRYMQH